MEGQQSCRSALAEVRLSGSTHCMMLRQQQEAFQEISQFASERDFRLHSKPNDLPGTGSTEMRG